MTTPDALAARLRDLLGAASLTDLEQLSGGASQETWCFRADGRALVLQARRVDKSAVADRRPSPPAAPLLRAAGAAGVPVAAVVAAGADDAVLGAEWIVTEHVAGTADAREILATADPVMLLDGLASALAAVHRMPADVALAPPMTDPLADLHALDASLDQPHPVFALAFRELARDRPPAGTPCLVHGDFRMGNVLVDGSRVAAVLDWELAHVGEPLSDLGWLCVRAWRFGRPDRAAAGLGTRDELAEAYERHAGVAVDRDALRWWELLGTLRWGVFCVLQAFTHLSGAAASLEHAVIGRRACEVEWDLLELLDPGGDGRFAAPSETPPPALHDRPTAEELLDAARVELGDHVLPALEGRAAFRLRVALRALGIVGRELRHEPAHAAGHAAALASLGVADERELAAAIAAGAFDDRRDELCAALRAVVRAKLEVANPRHLEPVGAPR